MYGEVDHCMKRQVSTPVKLEGLPIIRQTVRVPLYPHVLNITIVHYTGAGDLESQPLEEERRRSFLLFRFYSLTKLGLSLYLLSVTVWYLQHIVE